MGLWWWAGPGLGAASQGISEAVAFTLGPMGIIGGFSLVAQTVKSLPAMQETRVPSPGQEDPLEKEMATHSGILAGKPHGQRSLAGYSPWNCKESDITERLTLSL